jgi:poly-gamma-glutamate synthesis protein (capsule biosynthesis protein)
VSAPDVIKKAMRKPFSKLHTGRERPEGAVEPTAGILDAEKILSGESDVEPVFGPDDTPPRRIRRALAVFYSRAGSAGAGFVRSAGALPRSVRRKLSEAGPKRIAAGVLALLAAAGLVVALTNVIYGKITHFSLFSHNSTTLTLELSPEAKQDLGAVVDEYARSHRDLKIEYGATDPDVIIGGERRPGFRATLIEARPPLVLKAGRRSMTLRPRKAYWFQARTGGLLLANEDSSVSDLEDYLKAYQAEKPTATLTAVGDIIPGRHVAERMAQHGTAYPFKAIAPFVKGADVVFGDLECPLSDRIKPAYSGTYFIAPRKTVDGLKMLGLDVVSVANNHSTNLGLPPFTDTLKLLKANGIQYAGGGYNYDEAHRPAIVEANGTKFAFLSYNTIKDSIDAQANQPGVAWISMYPYYPDDPNHIKKVQEDIRNAKKQADFVVASFHWSQEDVYYPSPSMKNLAYAALEAGADMVIGNHPHTIQPIEYHDDRFIAYSMGNFIFDQMQRDQTREGYFMKCTFKGGLLTRMELVPYKIYDYAQPRVLKGKAGQQILDHVLEISGKGGSR